MEKKQIHVLVIPSWYPTEEAPLSGIFFKEQTINLQNNGVKVGVVYPEIRWLSNFTVDRFLKNHFQIKQYNENGIVTIRKHAWNIYPKFPKKQAENWVKQAEKLANKYIKAYGKPDIIQAHSTLWGGYAAMKLSQEYKIPYIITEHSSDYINVKMDEWKEKCVKDILENSNRAFAVSKQFSKMLSEKFSTKKEIETIYNPVDMEFFSRSIKDKSLDKFIFLNVGFLRRIKGMDILIKAFTKAFKGNESVELRLGGDGDEKTNLKELVQNLEMSKQIKFLGALSRKEVKEEMDKSNVFALSSRFETFGVVLIEALSMGIPVISTKCGGPEDIICDKVGKLVEKENVDELAKALIYLYNNYNNYDPKELIKYCRENFSSEFIAKKLLQIYKNTIDDYLLN